MIEKDRGNIIIYTHIVEFKRDVVFCTTNLLRN